jgi:hypothetical protein
MWWSATSILQKTKVRRTTVTKLWIRVPLQYTRTTFYTIVYYDFYPVCCSRILLDSEISFHYNCISKTPRSWYIMTEEVIHHFFLNYRNMQCCKRFAVQRCWKKKTNLTEFSPVSPVSMLSSGFDILARREDLVRAQCVTLLSFTHLVPRSHELQPGTEQYM